MKVSIEPRFSVSFNDILAADKVKEWYKMFQYLKKNGEVKLNHSIIESINRVENNPTENRVGLNSEQFIHLFGKEKYNELYLEQLRISLTQIK